ncbi:hypothetical protein [Helicobacter cinaedi]|uniref:hypothetical protein n=2 Tax=Helicobacter cinaedi TaxID=213 RepID=UPI000DA1E90F|nr:hypothetical protein [Helicobacter cinaedi]
MRYANSGKFGVAIVLSAILLSGLNAQIIYTDKFFYRDFLDLGQNRGGAFSAGAENVVIHSSKTPGISMSFEAPIIDQSARSNNGNSTSLGRNFAITATHMNTITDPSSTATNELKWGNTLYATQTNKPQQSGNNGLDVKFLRYRKYIVEGQTEIFDTSLPLTNGRTSKPNETDQKQNLETLKNALEAYKNADGSILAFQAGQGLLSIRGGDGTSFNSAGISDLTGLRSGSFGELWDNMLYGESSVKNYGLQVTVGLTNDFYNAITSGDSGTGFCIYNKNEQK